MKMSWEIMHRPSPGEMCLGKFFLASRSTPTRCPVRPCCRAGHGFLSLAAWSSPGGGCAGPSLAGGGQGLVDGWLEAAHVLHGGTVCLHGLHVLIQDGKHLIVQDLVLSDPVRHFLQGLRRTGPLRLGAGGGDREIKGKQEKNSARVGSRVLPPQ